MDVIEIMARAIYADQWGHSTKGETHPLERQYAKAAIKALHDAGYAIVPVSPTPEMAKVGVFVADTGAAIPAYEAMVRAYAMTAPDYIMPTPMQDAGPLESREGK